MMMLLSLSYVKSLLSLLLKMLLFYGPPVHSPVSENPYYFVTVSYFFYTNFLWPSSNHSPVWAPGL